MLDLLCKEVTDRVGVYYISEIRKHDDTYCFCFSDKFGNAIDMMPLCIDEKNGIEQDYSEILIDGEECEIPREYMPYKNMVIINLQKNMNSEIITASQIALLVNYLYYIDFMAYEAYEIYEICNYFISLVIDFCGDNELNNVSLLERNTIIKSFLDMSINEKKEVSKEYAYKTSAYNKIYSDSEIILGYALLKHDGKDINLLEIEDFKDRLFENIGLCINEINNSDDPILDKNYLLKKIKWLQKQISMEAEYCLVDGSTIMSERMKESTSQGKTWGNGMFENHGTFDANVKWGNDK